MSAGVPRAARLMALLHQFIRFFGVGLVAMVGHYATLIGLVELARVESVRAAVAGYLVGGLLSYLLNRRFTYDTERSHGAALWRFMLIAGVGFGLTWGLMVVLARHAGWHYLPAQLLTTGIVMLWSFFGHKYVSFADSR